MADSSRMPGAGNQAAVDTDNTLAAPLTAAEAAALLDGLREQVVIVDRAGEPCKQPTESAEDMPTRNTTVPEADRKALLQVVRDCAERGSSHDVTFRIRQDDHFARGQARVRATGNGQVLIAWCATIPAAGTVRASNNRYRVEDLLMRWSETLANAAPDGIDTAVDTVLGEAARDSGVDLAQIYQVSDDHRQLRNSHSWRWRGIAGAQAAHRRLPARALPWVLAGMRRGETLQVRGPADFPEQAARDRALYSERGVHSLLAVPLVYSGELRGLMTFETVTDKGEWSHEAVYLARRLGDLVAAALQRKQSEERIFRLAYYDQLTGLPNRVLLRSRLHRLLRLRRRPFGLVLIDLDDASILNDVMGHDVGDLLLRTLSNRLEKFAGSGEILARWGGDAFMLTVPLDDDPRMTTARLTALRKGLAAPVLVDGHELRISSCMGMAEHPRHTSEVDEMIRFTEIALNQAKHQGRGSLVVFDSEMQHRAARRNHVERRLREAVESQAFDLHYQPQMCARTGELLGAEALIRWYDEELGQVAPDRFIDLAEETGLILPMGEWLVQRACADLSRWRTQGLWIARLAINVAGPQLLDDQFPYVLERELHQHGLPADALELEITESALMHHHEPGLALLHRLRELGIGIAVDDFGTGYSSLGQIKHLPVSKLKIDRSFIQDIFADPDDRAIVTAIIAMAHQLGLQVVAEGVENRDQLLFLREQGCDMIQGYIHGRAAAPTTFLRRMLRRRQHRKPA